MTTIITVSSVGVQGPIGPEGPAGPDGPQGPAGQGVPTGGTTDQVLKKNSSTNYDTSWTSLTTSAIPEGTNLYYTDERVDDRVASLLVAGAGINLSYNDLLNTITISATGGGDVSSVFGRTGAVTAQSGDYTTSLTWARSFLFAPFPLITPTNANAALLSGVSMVFPTTSTTNMILTTGATALLPSTVYTWAYHMGT